MGPFWHSKSASKPSHRSGLAAVLPPSELGSVFSLIETISATFPLILAPLASATYTAELEKEMALFNVYTGEQKARHICPISNYLFLVFDLYSHPFPTPTFGHSDQLPWSLGSCRRTSNAAATSSLFCCRHHSSQIFIIQMLEIYPKYYYMEKYYYIYNIYHRLCPPNFRCCLNLYRRH